MPKFSDILDRKAEDIKRPPNPPVGHYLFQVLEAPAIDSVGENGRYERLTFKCSIIQPTDDVDTEELAEYGKIEGAQLRKVFMFDTDPEEQVRFARTENDLKRFLEALSIGFSNDSDMAVKEALSAAVNAQFIGEVSHRPDPKDAEVIYAEIGRTAPVE